MGAVYPWATCREIPWTEALEGPATGWWLVTWGRGGAECQEVAQETPCLPEFPEVCANP